MSRERILAPSILAADFTILGEQIKEVKACGAKYLHIDVMDGMFVPSISFGLPLVESIRKVSDIFFDVHLMIEEPKRYIKQFREAGADGITVHLEAMKDAEETLKMIRDCGARVGLSVKPGTDVEAVYPYLSLVDMVLIMTVEPGFGGQEYIHSCTEKIRKLRDKIESDNLNVNIEIDGGVREDTIKEPLDAGANVIVAGSAVFCGDIKRNVDRLMKMF